METTSNMAHVNLGCGPYEPGAQKKQPRGQRATGFSELLPLGLQCKGQVPLHGKQTGHKVTTVSPTVQMIGSTFLGGMPSPSTSEGFRVCRISPSLTYRGGNILRKEKGLLMPECKMEEFPGFLTPVLSFLVSPV